MTNALKGEFTVTVGPAEVGGADEVLTLAYDWDALCVLEDYLDMGVISVLIQLQKGYRLKLARGLFWAGLRMHYPRLTLADADALMRRGGGPLELFKVLCAGFERAFPRPEEGKTAEDPRKPAATPATDGIPSTVSASGSSTD